MEVSAVDDCQYNDSSIHMILKNFNMTTENAINGEEAFKKIKSRYEEDRSTYALIIIDFSEPFCSFAESTMLIRSYL